VYISWNIKEITDTKTSKEGAFCKKLNMVNAIFITSDK
jgi:hypothetical protein